MHPRRLVSRIRVICAFFLLGGCVTPSAPPTPQDRFYERLLSLCGQRLEGRIVSPPVAADATFAGKLLVAHVRDCSPQEMRIPFSVGEDHSRTWIITRSGTGLRLKHDHRHDDGTEDKVSQYGGDTLMAGTDQRQEFPADAFTKELLVREGNAAGAANVWAMEVGSTAALVYELRRPGRFFRVEFAPPARR